MVHPASVTRSCTKVVMKRKAQRTTREAQTILHVASQPEVEQITTIQSGSTVFLYREVMGWQQYELVRINGEDIHVILPRGKLTSFPIIVVLPYHHQVTKVNEMRKPNEDDHTLGKVQKI